MGKLLSRNEYLVVAVRFGLFSSELILTFLAATGFIWVIIWALFVTNKPGKSKFLSDAEKEYLENKNGMHLPTIAGKKRVGQKPFINSIFEGFTLHCT